MKTLIINGSPRINGNTATLINKLKENLDGEVTEISVYRDNIHPCIDCRYCIEHNKCSIEDDMSKIYEDDYDNLVIASPVYYGMLTGPLVSFASRLQVYHSLQPTKNSPRVLHEKKAALILTGGGKDNSINAVNFSFVIFNTLNAVLDDENIVTVFNTDNLDAVNNIEAMKLISDITSNLNNR